MARTFKTPQEKAEFYIRKYTDIILNATKKDVGKIKKATGNRESTKSLKLSAAGALWLTICENPEETKFKTLKMATDLFSSWIKDEYNEEILRNRNRKSAPESYITTPWGTNLDDKFTFVSQIEGPDKRIEREIDLKQLVKMVDKWISEWGPHTTVWAIASLRNSKGVLDTARKLGFTDTDLADTKTKTKIRNIYRILGEIQLELENGS